MDTPHPDIADVERTTAPGILIFSDHRGVPLSFNPAARRLLDADATTGWEQVVDADDLDRFRLELQKATASQATVDGWFRLRRFDNAIRQFILRAEPRFDVNGQFFGHLISGLDVSGLPAVSEVTNPASERSEVRELAARWHDWIVKDVTVISISAEVIVDQLRELQSSEADQPLNIALSKLQRAAESLRRDVDVLLQESRSG
ncbi:MAG: PAS domain-containing protein [Planctomycetaceae bacterium]|nr:PAS domain-containing protein [Planctomycetaceae bacterium]